MTDVACNTSPFQYLHQLGLLRLLPALVGAVTVPPVVVAELDAGRSHGVDVPDIRSLEWVRIRTPVGVSALPLVNDLGPGEAEVLMLALESPGTMVLLDDNVARQAAGALGIPFKGTLGLLLEAKRAGLLPSVSPLLDQLQALRFRIAPSTRSAVLELAGETPRRV